MGFDKETIEKIQELSLQAAGTCTINGRTYTAAQVRQVTDPRAEVMHVATLQAVVDYFNLDDRIIKEDTFIHVVDPTTVRLISKLDPFQRDREVYIQAGASTTGFMFGHSYAVAKFIVALRAGFVQGEAMDALIKYTGNMKLDSSIRQQDDGVTQVITVKKGIDGEAWKAAPKDMLLAPWRTFVEVEQPESIFIFRAEEGRDGLITVSLHEVEDPHWQLVAIKRVAEWLKDILPGVPIIA
ncbi:MAG: hypothetical protein IH612_04855 [Desulfofustis sp.]|nr:hypothetical protein [Desulfofustis sp.]